MAEQTPQTTTTQAPPPAAKPVDKPVEKDQKAATSGGVALTVEHPKGVIPNQEREGSTPSPATKPAAEVQQEREARRIALLKKETERVASDRAAFEAKQKHQETEIGALRKDSTEYRELRELAAKDPLAAIQRLNVDYDKLIQFALEKQDLESNPAIKEVRELKALLAAEEKKRSDAELNNVRGQHQRQIDNAVREIQTAIDGDPEKYEFLKTAGAAKDVFQRIYDVFTQTTKRDAQGRVVQVGRTLTTQEACDLLEAEYEESWKSIAGLKKVGAFFQSQQASPDKNKNNDTKNKGERDAKSPVLSNSNTSGPVQATRLTKKEKSARAFEAMRAAAGH